MPEHGGIIVDGVQVATTLQCPHCGGHFQPIKGSGKRRAWCFKCDAVTCGNPVCDVCIPVEARLEHREGSRTKYDDVIKSCTSEGAILL